VEGSVGAGRAATEELEKIKYINYYEKEHQLLN